MEIGDGRKMEISREALRRRAATGARGLAYSDVITLRNGSYDYVMTYYVIQSYSYVMTYYVR